MPRRGPLVLAAHPDDETIGAGGVLVRRGRAVLVHLTDGVPRDRRFWPASAGESADAYRALRRRELRDALEAGGVMAECHSLGARDQEAVAHAAALARALAELVERGAPPVLITHPYEGGHPDHDAAALVARAALALLRRRGAPVPPLVEMTSYHAAGGRLVTGRFLQPGPREVALALAPGVRATKERMLAAFASQRAVLAPFGVAEERFRRAPPYRFDEPPHEGAPWYERLGLPVTWTEWRVHARRVVRELGLEELELRPAGGEGAADGGIRAPVSGA